MLTAGCSWLRCAGPPHHAVVHAPHDSLSSPRASSAPRGGPLELRMLRAATSLAFAFCVAATAVVVPPQLASATLPTGLDLVAASTTAALGAPLQGREVLGNLTLVDQTGRGAACLDGSPPGYWFRAAASTVRGQGPLGHPHWHGRRRLVFRRSDLHAARLWPRSR